MTLLDLDDIEAAELRRQDAGERRHQRALLRHPDCTDPDHPGCEYCLEEGDD